MALIDLADDTFVACEPARLAAVVAEPGSPAAWWPDLRLTTTRDRGAKGRQWRVDGPLVGTAEIWLEPWGDGVLVHLYLRLDPATRSADGGPGRQRWASRERAARAQAWKRDVHALKDALEGGRRPGTPARSGLKAPGARADLREDES